jgi:molecular chaperone DnaK (HSP70)
MTAARFLVGIDLGTVNSALAAVDLARGGDLGDAVEAFPVPQLVAPGEVRDRALLPSCAYLPGPELPPGSTRLPWGEGPVLVGELAREQGARVPGRLVTSAKSWLANARADRRAPILPWGAPEGVPRLSPVAASALYLAHLRDAWDHRHPDAPLAAQEVVITVPASFDEVARALTLEAAREAGLGAPTLLEEPAAAFHDWAGRHRADLAAALAGARLVLVVDVGGGTTDLTLVAARVDDGRPAFTRVAVGDHLLLGGDNVDLALARAAEARLGERLDAARFASLVHGCRLAKERLLADGGPEEVAVAIAGRGSRLVETARSTLVTREEARRVLLDGFFPLVAPDERPRRAPRTAGLAELGLPYEPDPAVTRHVAAFLAAHAAESGQAQGGLARPDAILVNGGTFTPAAVRVRVREVVSGFFPGAPPVALLASPALELAVARGAVWAALVRRGVGVRIGGGTPRAYYVGIATPDGERALCVVPRHLEEGSRVTVPRPFALAVGRPVRFALWASSHARLERPGDVVPISEDLVPLPAVEAVLGVGDAAAGAPRPGAGGGHAGAGAGELTVRLEAVLTEIGTLELWCVAAGPGAAAGQGAPAAHAGGPAVPTPPAGARGTAEQDATEPAAPARLAGARGSHEGGAGRYARAAHSSGAHGGALGTGGARWRLEFSLRGGGDGAEGRAEVAAAPRGLDDARALVDLFYGKRAAVDRRDVKGLLRELERLLGPRERWSTPLVRSLWAALHAGRGRRRRSADHERLWLQLTGFCLRPGFGAPLDGWRARETFAAFGEGLQYQADPKAWQAWWVMWRRIAGGLDAPAQERIFAAIAPFVAPRDPRRPPPRVAGVKPEALDELVRLTGALERIDPARKVETGGWVLARIEADGPAPHLLWALGRIGARVPFAGSAHLAVPPEFAEEWTRRLVASPAPRAALAFPLAQLARRSGDRARDVSDEVRADVLAALAAGGAPEETLRAVREVVAATEEEEQRVFGESLPAGLRLVEDEVAGADAGADAGAPAT